VADFLDALADLLIDLGPPDGPVTDLPWREPVVLTLPIGLGGQSRLWQRLLQMHWAGFHSPA
jgi:hypothetical protein